MAGELGIKAPSLYKHVADKRELEIALIADGFLQQAEAFEKAGTRNSHGNVTEMARSRIVQNSVPNLFRTRSGSHGKKSVSVMIERMSPVGFVM